MSHQELSRRQFCIDAGISAAGTVAAGLIPPLGIYNTLNTVGAVINSVRTARDWWIAVPAESRLNRIPVDFPNPGWVESRARQMTSEEQPDLIQIKLSNSINTDGHSDFLRFVVLNNDIFNNPDLGNPGILQRALTEFFSTPPSGNVPLMGDAYIQHVRFAAEALVKKFPENYKGLANKNNHSRDEKSIIEDLVSGKLSDPNISRVALYSLTAVYGPYLTPDIITKNLNIKIHPGWFKDEKTPWWVKVYRKFPKGFPVDESESNGTPTDKALRTHGSDRTVHLWACALTASKLYDPTLRDNIPRLIKAAAKGRTLDEQVENQLREIGFGIEVSETGNFIDENIFKKEPVIRDEDGNPPYQGFADTVVWQDLGADQEGYEVAKMIEYGASPQLIKERLNKPSLNKIPRNITIFHKLGPPNSKRRWFGNGMEFSLLQIRGY